MTKKRPPAVHPVPKDLEPDTGLPTREAPLGVSVNSDPKREAAAEAFAIAAARSMSDDKCEDVLVLDLRGRSQVTDFFVIGSGASDRQMRSAASNVSHLCDGTPLDVYRSNLNSKDQGWVFLDLVDVVAHVMTAESRQFYDLEMLWGDAPRIHWEREGGEPSKLPVERNRAGLKPGDLPQDSR